MTGRHGTPARGGVDLAEVARDAELLDLMADRAELPADDPVLSLLAAFAAEVDDGLAVFLQDLDVADGLDVAEPALTTAPVAPGPTLTAVPADHPRSKRSMGSRAGVVAVVLGATLSVSGVAAAVTGDPLSAYKGIVSAVAAATGHGDLPPQAAAVAQLNHHLAGTRAQIARGDLEDASQTLAALRRELASADLTDKQRAALARRIASLEAALARANARAQARESVDPKVPPGSTRSHQPRNTRTAEPKATRTAEPKATRTDKPKATRTTGPKAVTAVEPEATTSVEPEATSTSEPAASAAPRGGGSAHRST